MPDKTLDVLDVENHIEECHLIQTCVCGHKLIPTITRGSVEKYLKLAKRLVEKYDVGEYQKGRIHALSDEIELVFGKSQGDQSLLTDYA